MTSLRVVVRIRPFQPHDNEPSTAIPAVRASTDVISKVSDETDADISVSTTLSIIEKNLQFDRVFPPSATQNEVYLDVAYPLIQSVLEGINACVFAFGNTGAGKSYSMLGPEGGRQRNSRGSSLIQDGILPRVASELFRRIARIDAETKEIQNVMRYKDSSLDSVELGSSSSPELSAYQVRVQFLEVYRESVFDLLGGAVSVDRDPSSSLSLREDLSSGSTTVFAQNATEVRVTSTEQLINLVKRGAKARTTAATGVHAHSSRSHALLILAVERRWRNVTDGSGADNVNTRTARFTLVDLAGAESMEASHGGEVDKAGTATNIGLLVLGRVITALAENSNSSTLASHIPYRDSTLTRLMQSSLSGSAQTVMLACVSPSNKEVNFTHKNLQYALSARNVALQPKVVDITLENIEKDPMCGDQEDEDRLLDRRCIMIECGTYGDVFARCVGDPDDPLILYVHGSGPKNSSMVWNECARELQELVNKSNSSCHPEGFFHVAIDCPGYGRSISGNKQTIRSFPASFIQTLITALGRRSAACVVGSSQGAAAALNAALELPDMIHTVAVCHPVCHAPLERFSGLVQPVLMVYDISDDGHPVTVGRTLRKYISDGAASSRKVERECRYFEFDSSPKSGDSCEKDWLRLNFAKELYSLLTARWKDFDKKRLGGRRVVKMPELSRIAGGLVKWGERFNGEVLPWYGTYEDTTGNSQHRQQLDNDDTNQHDDDHDFHPVDPENTWRVVLDPETSLIVYENIGTRRRVKIRPTTGKVIVHNVSTVSSNEIGPGQKSKTHKINGQHVTSDQNISNQSGNYLFSDNFNSASSFDFESEDEKKERLEKEKDEQKRSEAAQTNCDLCKKTLIIGSGASSLRLPRCRCALCACCVERTILYTRQCPCCGESPLKVDKNGVVVTEPIVDYEGDPGGMIPGTTDSIQHQFTYLNKLLFERDHSRRLILEYGNSSKKLSSKTSYVTFVKVIEVAKRKDLSTPVDVLKVDFNINPGYSKPTASVRRNDNAHSADGATGYNSKTRTFSFEYAMGRSYPCFLTIHLDGSLTSSGGRKPSFPKIEIPYHVQDCKNVFKRRVILQFSTSKNGTPVMKKSIDLNEFATDPDTPKEVLWGNAWVRFGSRDQGGVDVEYLPEGGGGKDLSPFYGQEREIEMGSVE